MFRFRFGRRRQSSAGGIVFVLVALGVGGWNAMRGARFAKACAAITEGQPLSEAEQTLLDRGGRRVTLADPRPNHSEFRFKSMFGSDRGCDIESAEDLVIRASGNRQVTF